MAAYGFRELMVFGSLCAILWMAGCASKGLMPPGAMAGVGAEAGGEVLLASSASSHGVSGLTQAQPSERAVAAFENLVWPNRQSWRQWGSEHLRSGDLVFVRSNYRLLLGTFNLSEFLSELTDSPFSHVGFVVVEQGVPMVYDASDRGVTSQPFERFVTKGKIERVAVMRPSESCRGAVAKAVAFVQLHQRERTKFDSRFEPGSERLYCTELVIEAYRQGGVELCEPNVVGQLPGIATIAPTSLKMAKWATGLSEQDRVWLPGNREEGLYSSSYLTTVLVPVDGGQGMAR
jgi:hypothetical protein